MLLSRSGKPFGSRRRTLSGSTAAQQPAAQRASASWSRAALGNFPSASQGSVSEGSPWSQGSILRQRWANCSVAIDLCHSDGKDSGVSCKQDGSPSSEKETIPNLGSRSLMFPSSFGKTYRTSSFFLPETFGKSTDIWQLSGIFRNSDRFL